MNKLEQQIVTASVLGANAFKKGIAPTPCRDGALMGANVQTAQKYHGKQGKFDLHKQRLSA